MDLGKVVKKEVANLFKKKKKKEVGVVIKKVKESWHQSLR